MADDDTAWAVPAPPPFDAAASLVALRRQLRELKPLAESGAGARFEVRGQSVIELAAADGRIDARLARRPARATAWTDHPITSAAALRRFVDDVRQRLPRWERDE
ncbi:MAG: hypothetical protein ABIX12_00730 [Rubrivivax sp.]